MNEILKEMGNTDKVSTDNPLTDIEQENIYFPTLPGLLKNGNLMPHRRLTAILF